MSQPNLVLFLLVARIAQNSTLVGQIALKFTTAKKTAAATNQPLNLPTPRIYKPPPSPPTANTANTAIASGVVLQPNLVLKHSV